MNIPKVAFYWNASCGGCEEAFIDLAEKLLPITERIDIVFWPVAIDAKRSDIESLKSGEIFVSFINGSIRMSEQIEMVELLREKSQIIVAFGSCAHIGGIPGLANFYDRESILECIYRGQPTVDNPNGDIPKEISEIEGKKLYLPRFMDTVKTLDQVIDVDYYLPGCAPPPDIIIDAFEAILRGNLPDKGTVFASSKSLCDTCPRNDTKPEKMSIEDIRRVDEITPDSDRCFLADGLICFGPATRSGCGERCINANMPCRGCFGPIEGVKDHGARILAFISSILGVENEENIDEDELERMIQKLLDPGGLFYMYSLPSSMLKRKNTGKG